MQKFYTKRRIIQISFLTEIKNPIKHKFILNFINEKQFMNLIKMYFSNPMKKFELEIS